MVQGSPPRLPPHHSHSAWALSQRFPFLARPGRRKITFPFVSSFPRAFGLAAV